MTPKEKGADSRSAPLSIVERIALWRSRVTLISHVFLLVRTSILRVVEYWGISNAPATSELANFGKNL